jgi:hypothetical protein
MLAMKRGLTPSEADPDLVDLAAPRSPSFSLSTDGKQARYARLMRDLPARAERAGGAPCPRRRASAGDRPWLARVCTDYEFLTSPRQPLSSERRHRRDRLHHDPAGMVRQPGNRVANRPGNRPKATGHQADQPHIPLVAHVVN